MQVTIKLFTSTLVASGMALVTLSGCAHTQDGEPYRRLVQAQDSLEQDRLEQVGLDRVSHEEAGAFRLGETTTEQILAELREALGDQEADGLVRVAITTSGGKTLLGVDYRAERIDPDMLPKVELLGIDNVTTIFGAGSCTFTVVTSSVTSSWETSDDFCPPHRPH